MKVLSNRDDYLFYLKALLPKNPKVLEVGVEAGHFSHKIMNIVEPGELHLLDPWEVNAFNGKVYSQGHLKNIPTAYSNPHLRQNIENKYAEEIKGGVVFLHQGYSNELVGKFEEGYFDFIYLDGCHLYESVKQDLSDYIGKIALGGILGGHDYIGKETLFVQEGVTYSNQLGYGVKRAVDEFLDDRPEFEMFAVVSDSTPFPDWAIRRKV